MTEQAIRTVLSVAGTDPTGGAGILADVKTISALGGYALAVPTAIIAQNSRSVREIWPLTAPMITAQLEAVEEEFSLSAIKIGLVPSQEVVTAVASFLKKQDKNLPVVFDPVLKASAGQDLCHNELIPTLKAQIFPYLHVITPNLVESAALLGEKIASSREEMRIQAGKLGKLRPFWVLLKGGHLGETAQSPDLLLSPEGQDYWLETPRLKTLHGRGTGCTLSSALAFYLTCYDVYEAVDKAKNYLYNALLKADDLGLVEQRGPLNHFGWDHEKSF